MSEDKKHQPTAKKLKQATKEGQIINSKEFINWLILISTILVIINTKDYIINNLINIFTQGFNITRDDIFKHDFLDKIKIIKYALLIIIPLIFIVNIITVFGYIITKSSAIKKFNLQFNRLNPLSGIKRIFSINNIFELIKAILKISLIFMISYFIIKNNINHLIYLHKINDKLAIINSINFIINFVLYLILSLIIVVIIDIPWQIYQHHKKLMMSDFEIKQEHKENEGNPEIKSKIKRIQQELASRRMLEAIPTANVIINNPNHISVALKYDPDKDQAPILIAKGSDLIALKIRELAKKNHITQVYSKQLARAIFYSTECNKPIHSDLYLAVAQVLAYIYQIDNLTNNNNLQSVNLDNIQIPNHLLR